MTNFSVIQGLVGLVDANDNEAVINASGELKVALDATASLGKIKIEGDPSGNLADVSSSGELKVVQAPPTPPPGTTPFNIIASGNLGGNANGYDTFTIPNGTNAIVQTFKASAEGESRSKCELYSDPLGVDATGPNGGDNIPASWVLIDVTYTDNNKNVSPQSEDVSYPGDGTARIVLRRKRLEGGGREIFGRIDGYYS